MEGCRRRLCSSWWRPPSSSTRFLGFMLPLMVVSGLLFLLGSSSSYYYPRSWSWSSVFTAPGSFKEFVPKAEGGGSGLELRREVVAGGAKREEALAVDYNIHGAAAAPPLAVEVREAETPT
ncbi:hypothetical protein OROMI_012212 [Orobanche minor]